MKQIVCIHCGNTVAGEQKFEVRCYHCGKYVYLTEGLTPQDQKKHLQTMASQFAYAYVPKNVREYVDRFGLSQDPTTLKWFRDHEEDVKNKIEDFLEDNINEESLKELYERYQGDKPFILFVLDELKFPIDRSHLEWSTVDVDNCEY